jgi:hypothetical protein
MVGLRDFESQTTRGVRRESFDVIQKSHHPDGRGCFGEKSPRRRVAALTRTELVDARAFSSMKLEGESWLDICGA